MASHTGRPAPNRQRTNRRACSPAAPATPPASRRRTPAGSSTARRCNRCSSLSTVCTACRALRTISESWPTSKSPMPSSNDRGEEAAAAEAGRPALVGPGSQAAADVAAAAAASGAAPGGLGSSWDRLVLDLQLCQSSGGLTSRRVVKLTRCCCGSSKSAGSTRWSISPC